MKKTAVITGITGQDGSYLAELLLEKGYQVYGLKRRTSGNDLGCSEHLIDDIEVVEGDLLDFPSLASLCRVARPDEFYNLAAQSHVGTSFTQPVYTAESTGIGTLNCLEAIRQSGIHTKFYQASTSELFGGLYGETLMNEESPFHPRSPYGVAKLYGYWMTINYRESYKMFACNGILFNHETLTYGNPLIIRDQNQEIDILPIGDIARFHTGVIFNLDNHTYQEGKPLANLEVWDKSGWTKVKWVSGYPHDILENNKNIKVINSRNFSYTATADHVAFLENNEEKATKDITIGDKTLEVSYPENTNTSDITLEEAEFLGMLVGDGNLNRQNPRFTNKDLDLKKHFVHLWTKFTGLTDVTYIDSYSGFTGETIGQVICKNTKNINFDIYCHDISPFEHYLKKVPKKILNASPEAMEAFLNGYNACDGLKSNPCTYRYKNFKTNSPTLATGLLYLVSVVSGQDYNITVEESFEHGKRQLYYSINLLSPVDNIIKEEAVQFMLKQGYSQRAIAREIGVSRGFIRKIQNGYHVEEHHLRKIHNEVKKIIPLPDYDGWLFDLETESGTFCAGIGQGLVHNSPRRGPNFVTRKITKAAAAIKQGKQDKLYLGNLDSRRDWGHARDYVKGMYLMLQHNEPGEFVLATGKTHSVRDFCKAAFDVVDLNYEDYVEIDPRFYRPAEVDVLRGDWTKANKVLGWEPETSFEDLVAEMVKNDLEKSTNAL